MIKANELRIGNLLNVINTAPIVVTADHIKAISEGDKDYSPILLTPEWLEQCGFEKDGAVENGHYRHNGIYLFEDDELPGLFHDILAQFNGTRTEIKYLHQLQNLYFALTGEELIITL